MKLPSFLKSLLNRLGLFYAEMLCRREYYSQTFRNVNERPVEYQFVFRQLTKKLPETVLDVGTGVTALPSLMRSCGFVVTAIDNIKDYWPSGMINRHYYVINDDIINPRLDRKFDFITCVSVLEHIKDHSRAVKSMFSLLNPGGHMILTFPYNETGYVENVYNLPASGVKEKLPFITQAFSRKELDQWMAENKGTVLEQEYWQFFTGDYWTCGEMITPPVEVDKNQRHHISCVLIQKNKG